MKLLIYYAALINIAGFAAMALDKRRAVLDKRRIRERTLLIIAVIGGSAGAMAGMYVCRHKTRHLKFVIGLPLILIIQLSAALLFLAGRSRDLKAPSAAVSYQLSQLENLSAQAAYSLLTADVYPGQIPDESELSSEEAGDMAQACDRLFDHFSYRITGEKISGSGAQVFADLTNLDMTALAKDLCMALTVQRIRPDGVFENDDATGADFDDYLALLRETLENNRYETSTRSVVFELEKTDGRWQIIQDEKLKDELVSGLISALSDPSLIGPDEVLTLFMDQFRGLGPEEWSEYLHMEDIFTAFSPSYAEKLSEKYSSLISSFYDWESSGLTVSESEASAVLKITSADMPLILTEYEKLLREYASSTEAITSDASVKADKAAQYLLECMEQYAAPTERETNVNLVHDGLTWQIVISDELTDALMGHIEEGIDIIRE